MLDRMARLAPIGALVMFVFALIAALQPGLQFIGNWWFTWASAGLMALVLLLVIHEEARRGTGSTQV